MLLCCPRNVLNKHTAGDHRKDRTTDNLCILGKTGVEKKGVVKALQLDVAWHCFLAKHDQVDQEVRLNARNMHQYIQYILVNTQV